MALSVTGPESSMAFDVCDMLSLMIMYTVIVAKLQCVPHTGAVQHSVISTLTILGQLPTFPRFCDSESDTACW